MLKLARDINALARTASWEMVPETKIFAFITLFGKGDWWFTRLEAVKKKKKEIWSWAMVTESLSKWMGCGTWLNTHGLGKTRWSSGKKLGLTVSQNKLEPMGWGELREWHRCIYTAMYKIASGNLLYTLGVQLSALWWPGGVGWSRVDGRSKREGFYIYIHVELIHVAVQKWTPHCNFCLHFNF